MTKMASAWADSRCNLQNVGMRSDMWQRDIMRLELVVDGFVPYHDTQSITWMRSKFCRLVKICELYE